jgi:hypothetical protein
VAAMIGRRGAWEMLYIQLPGVVGLYRPVIGAAKKFRMQT